MPVNMISRLSSLTLRANTDLSNFEGTEADVTAESPKAIEGEQNDQDGCQFDRGGGCKIAKVRVEDANYACWLRSEKQRE